MRISLNQVGKRYQQYWVFKGLDYTFEPGRSYAILGANGSGKSTLLRVLAGMQNPNKGTIAYQLSGTNVTPEKLYSYVSYCAPGMDIIEEMSLTEFLSFHFTFKKIIAGFDVKKIIEAMGLQSVSHKYIHDFSSGMKQRVKLAQAFFTDTPMLLLDEPCSNLDLQGVATYQNWLKEYTGKRLVIIASNDEREYEDVEDVIVIQDYK